jgi:WD40 repeat protein
MNLQRYLMFFISFVIACTLAACSLFQVEQKPTQFSDATVAATETATMTPLPTETPTPSPTPTLTSTPTLTPTPTLYVLQDTPLPASSPPIAAGNAAQVSALAEIQLSTVNDLAWTPDSSKLAVATHDRIELFDILTRDNLRTLYPETQGLVGIDFSPAFTGSWLVSGSRSGSEQLGYSSWIELWRGPDWQPRGILLGSTRGLSDLAFSPDGKLLATSYASPVEADNIIELYDTYNWIISKTLTTRSALNLAFSPDSNLLAVSPDRYSVRVWDISSGDQVLKIFSSFTGAAKSIAFSPTGTILAVGNYDGAVEFWDVATGTLIQTLQGPAAIESLAFSPDGQVLATSSVFEDNAIRLWSVTTGELLNTLEGHPQGATRLLFSPDGAFLVSGSYNGLLRIWGIRP